jgi:hypothetical protein
LASRIKILVCFTVTSYKRQAYAKTILSARPLLPWFFVIDAPAGNVEVSKVPMPQLAPLQWDSLRQQQGDHSKPLRIDVNLAVKDGKVYSVTVRRGTDTTRSTGQS